MKKQVCPKFINAIMVNNRSNKFGANGMLYNAAMKGLPLSLLIFIWTYSVFTAVTKFPYETSMYLSVSTSEPGKKSEISGLM